MGDASGATTVGCTIDAKSCSACGATDNLFQCLTCKLRLDGKGSAVAICSLCAAKPEEVSCFGKPTLDETSSPPTKIGFTCMPCAGYIKRKEQEKVFDSLKGPSPEAILKTISSKFPWAIQIAQAAPGELLEALQFCKRKLSGQRTIEALAESLANSNTHASLLLQTMGSSVNGLSSDTVTNKALRTFVKNQYPAVKYKAMLLPPAGSLLKAQRHFQDMLKVDDTLVVALAQERLFLIEYFEAQFIPTPSEKQRKRGDYPEIPEFALHLLRATFKSLSTGIKTSAKKEPEAELLVKTFYQDHITWAMNWSLMVGPRSIAPVPVQPSGQFMYSQPKGSGTSYKDYGNKDKGRFAPRDDGASLEPPTKLAKIADIGHSSPGKSAGKSSGAGSSKDYDDMLKLLAKPGDRLEASLQAYKTYPIESRMLWREACRNCFLAGKGYVYHSLIHCEELGNPCRIKCRKCHNGCHWPSVCPVGKQAP